MNNGNNRGLTDALELVKRLRNTLAEHHNSEFTDRPEQRGESEWQPLPDASRFEPTPAMRHLERIIQGLAKPLADVGDSARLPEQVLPPDEYWTLGSVTRSFPIRGIHLGFLEPVHRVPVVSHIPETVVAYLLTIPGDRDLLKREHHNQVGWHYHYLDFNRRRSDVVLCWDTRAVYAKGKILPLFQESHGKGRSDFPARPDLWGDAKKQSMHQVCAPDLDRWPIGEFRCASGKAGPVWPLSARLTPMPAQPQPTKLSTARARVR